MRYTATGKLGRLLHMLIYKSGNLPVVGTGTMVPDHEELVVPHFSNSPFTPRKGFFCL